MSNTAPPPSNKSCFGCPSLITSTTEQMDFFGKQLGVPLCARFGKPIGSSKTPDNKREEIARAIANTCSKHGEPKPVNVDWEQARFTIALPDPEVLRFNRRAQQDQVRTCRSCEHFVREDAVGRDLGYGTGLCAAKGNLILGHRLTYEARNCDERSIITNGARTDTSGLMLLPEYDADFTLSTDPVKYHHQMMKNFIDPEVYETDVAITASEEDEGIRAWRRIEDPATGNSTLLPIFRRDYFTPDQQKMIPSTGDDEHPEDYVDHAFLTYKVSVLWRELDETPAAWGQAGVGKTEFGRYMAWLMQVPYVRISVNGSTEVEDLAGKWLFENGETVWSDGRLTTGWSMPCVMLVDEPNAGQPDVYQLLRPMMDNSKQLVLDQAKGEHRDRQNYCHMLVAMNPAWDSKNVGTHVISDADANRMMHLNFELPPKELEMEILAKACSHDDYEISNETMHTIMGIAEDVRALCADDTLPITWGIRPQLKVARSSRWFDLMSCYRMASADFLEPEARETLMDVVKSHVE